MKFVIAALQLIVLVVSATMLWQLWHQFKQIPNDEIIGEERAKYLTLRLNMMLVSFAVEAVLSIVQIVLPSIS